MKKIKTIIYSISPRLYQVYSQGLITYSEMFNHAKTRYFYNDNNLVEYVLKEHAENPYNKIMEIQKLCGQIVGEHWLYA